MKIENKKENQEFEPEWLKNQAKLLLKQQKESYGDEEQNDIMNTIDNNEDDQL